MKYLFVFILMSLPFFSWFGQYYFSRKHSLLGSFKKHWTCYRGDWIFVVINGLFLFSVQISSLIIYFAIISLFINLYTHYAWGKHHPENNAGMHLYSSGTTHINGSGMIHFFFSAIEMTLLFSVFFLEPIKPFIYLELIFVFIFGTFASYGAYKINNGVTKMDAAAALTIFLLSIAKFALLLQ